MDKEEFLSDSCALGPWSEPNAVSVVKRTLVPGLTNTISINYNIRKGIFRVGPQSVPLFSQIGGFTSLTKLNLLTYIDNE